MGFTSNADDRKKSTHHGLTALFRVLRLLLAMILGISARSPFSPGSDVAEALHLDGARGRDEEPEASAFGPLVPAAEAAERPHSPASATASAGSLEPFRAPVWVRMMLAAFEGLLSRVQE